MSQVLTKSGLVASVLLLTLAIGCSSQTKTADSNGKTTTDLHAHDSKAWPEKMQMLSKTMSDLLPLISSRKKFNDPANAKKIEDDTQTLKSLAHSVKSGPQPTSDPSMQVISTLMEEDIARAFDALKNGNRDYARHVLRDSTSYCIQCHTQTKNGPEFPKLTLDVKLQDLSNVERAEFYAATRQFEPALENYRIALANSDFAKEDPFEYEASARTALAISVRVHKSPSEARTLIKTVRANKGLNPSLKNVSRSWDRSVASWATSVAKERAALGKENSGAAKKSQDGTPTQDLAQAEKLIAAAQKTQEFPLDHTQDITYFRASSILHDLLEQPSRTADFSARALYLAGLASEATRDMNFWTMHETMYEQCIRLKPASEQAKQCFGRLKDSIVMGYSGSGGTVIPPEISRRLNVYRTLAFGPETTP